VQCSVVTFSVQVRAIKRLRGNHGNTCEFGSLPRDPTGTEKQTNTVGPIHTPHPVVQSISDWFYPSFTREETDCSRSIGEEKKTKRAMEK
jgi:hypothetical protein